MLSIFLLFDFLFSSLISSTLLWLNFFLFLSWYCLNWMVYFLLSLDVLVTYFFCFSFFLLFNLLLLILYYLLFFNLSRLNINWIGFQIFLFLSLELLGLIQINRLILVSRGILAYHLTIEICFIILNIVSLDAKFVSEVLFQAVNDFLFTFLVVFWWHYSLGFDIEVFIYSLFYIITY